MSLRTIYLQRMLTINGRSSLSGRVLYDKLKELSEETLLGHLVYPDDTAVKVDDPRIKSDIIDASLLREFHPNLIFIEGGLFSGSDGQWRLPKEMAESFCQSGGVLVVADADVNEFYQKKLQYKEAGSFFQTYASYGPNDDGFPVYGNDRKRYWRGQRQILCDPKKMVISEWLRPIYGDIPEVLVGLPVSVSSPNLVASCNSDTSGTLHNDNWVDEIDACPFAGAAQIGSGFAVLIAGLVSGDAWLEGCAHNTRWLTNLVGFLRGEADADAMRRLSHRRSPELLFLSHRSTNKGLVRTISSEIKKRGVNVWFDEQELIPSQSLPGEISSALSKMTAFVLFWSASCKGAPWVERELNSAVGLLVHQRIPMIIVRFDDTPVPSIVADLFRIEALDNSPQEISARIVDAITRLRQRHS